MRGIMIDRLNKRQSGLNNFTPRRELGRTGFVATRLGIGDVADRQIPLETCVATVERALAAGLRLSEARSAQLIASEDSDVRAGCPGGKRLLVARAIQPPAQRSMYPEPRLDLRTAGYFGI